MKKSLSIAANERLLHKELGGCFLKRGMTFTIPNEYGVFLGEVLKPIDITKFSWRIDTEDSNILVDGQKDEELFPEGKTEMDGIELKHLIENKTYYMIFADLQAYPKGTLSHIKTYEEFIESQCELVLLVTDCSYVTIYCKNKGTLEWLYKNAVECGFEDVTYITDENDARTRLSVW